MRVAEVGPAPISDEERLSRYPTEEHLIVSKGEIRFRAFLPPSKERELSIMRTDLLSDADVWSLGDEAVARPSGRVIAARGDFLAPNVRDCKEQLWQLSVQPHEPPVRHAIIVGWPPTDQTVIRKSLAQRLRAKARVRVRPT